MVAAGEDADIDGGVDEEDFLLLLVAAERCAGWEEELNTPGCTAARKKAIVMELDTLVRSKPAYAEEAANAGLIPLVTRILTQTNDEEVMEAVARIITACSGPMACGGKVSEHKYAGVSVCVKEGALGDGLGARVWTVAHVLCMELAMHREFVAGQQVLEIGAGCGLCGLLAAKLGASNVLLTDVEGPVLRNLRECVRINAQALPGANDPSESGGDGWDWSCVAIRKMDWLDSLKLMRKGGGGQLATSSCVTGYARMSSGGGSDGKPPSAQLPTPRVSLDAATFYAHDLLRMAEDPSVPGCDLPAGLPLPDSFPRIIGSDVMYEPVHAQLVAAVLAHRLRPGGAALLCCVVRSARTFAAFADECARWGLRYRAHRLDVSACKEYGGVLGRAGDYEGGFLLMAVDHSSAPFATWHRQFADPES